MTSRTLLSSSATGFDPLMHAQVTPLNHESLTALLAAGKAPALSLFQPTHRYHPGKQQDPIRFGNLVKKLKQSLRQKYSDEESAACLAPFEQLAGDSDFWKQTLDGLAVFGAPDLFRVFALPRTVPELAIVADSFHTKPLWRFLQSTDRYQVLGLTRDRLRLFEGGRDGLDEIDLAPGVPRTMVEALGAELTEPHSTVASYGGNVGGPAAMHHGHGGKEPEIEIDAERFFRAIDRAILEHHSQPSRLPLLLAALPEHQSRFRELSHNPFLVARGIEIDPEALSKEQLCERAWEAMQPQYRARLAKLADQFGQAKASQLGLDSLEEVAKAAATGRIGTLLVEAGREMPGSINPKSGDVQRGELDHPERDDLLDDLGELVRAKGGEVMVIPAEQMPTETGLAATCRY